MLCVLVTILARLILVSLTIIVICRELCSFRVDHSLECHPLVLPLSLIGLCYTICIYDRSAVADPEGGPWTPLWSNLLVLMISQASY